MVGGHQHTEAVCGLPRSSSSKNRGKEKQRWLERLNSSWNRKRGAREGQRLREVMGAAWMKVLLWTFKGQIHRKTLKHLRKPSADDVLVNTEVESPL